MKNKNRNIITTLFIGTVLVGCSPSADKDSAINKTIDQKITKAQETFKDSAVDLSAYKYEQKKEFVELMKKQVAELEKSIKEISATIDNSSEAVKMEAKPKLIALREKAAVLNKQISEMEASTPTTWEGIKADSNKAYLSVKDNIKQMRQWISEKIAP